MGEAFMAEYANIILVRGKPVLYHDSVNAMVVKSNFAAGNCLARHHSLAIQESSSLRQLPEIPSLYATATACTTNSTYSDTMMIMIIVLLQ